MSLPASIGLPEGVIGAGMRCISSMLLGIMQPVYMQLLSPQPRNRLIGQICIHVATTSADFGAGATERAANTLAARLVE
jgi:hypothetical protein